MDAITAFAPEGGLNTHAYARRRCQAAVGRDMLCRLTPYLRWSAGGYQERQADPANVDVRGLIETGAQAAALPATELVEIVTSIAPEACAEVRDRTLIIWAEMALEDFRSVRKARWHRPESTEIRAA